MHIDPLQKTFVNLLDEVSRPLTVWSYSKIFPLVGVELSSLPEIEMEHSTMVNTPNLSLPYIMAAQAQKHVTHNEAIRALDAVVQIGVLDRDLTAPPTPPADGARYIVAVGASGAWAGNDGKLAAWQDGAWMFYVPQKGWLAWVADENFVAAWDGSAWIAAYGGVSLNPATGGLVGVNTTADTTNRLAVSAPATLLGHEGAGHQVKIVKDAAGDTASALFQTDFSGRAEIGLTGDDDLHVKVSADGSTWTEALSIERTTGRSVFKALVQWLGDSLGSGNVPWRYVPPSTDPAAPNFNFSVSSHLLDNGPVGETDYYDHTAHFGWNFVANTREDETQAAFGISFESKFTNDPAAPFGHEFHLQGIDVNGDPHRWMSFFLPIDGSAGSGGYVATDVFDLRNGAGTQLVKFDWQSGGRAVSLIDGVLFLADENNYAVMQQKNAAGNAFLSLPYYNAADVLRAPSAMILEGPRVSGGDFPGSFLTLNITSANSNDKAITVSAPAVTGNFRAMNFAGQVSGQLTTLLENSGNGDARQIIQTDGSGVGRPYISFVGNAGSNVVSMGCDSADSGKFKISTASTIHNSTKLTMDANRFDFALPVKLPSFTVATKPSASSAGAGAMIYVTDETGGAVPAFSDGTDWRRVMDRTVVS